MSFNELIKIMHSPSFNFSFINKKNKKNTEHDYNAVTK